MTGTDPATELSELSSKLGNVEAVLNPDAMNREADRLKEQVADPGLWDDQDRAQAVHRRLSYLEGELGRLTQLHQRLDDTRVMFELADRRTTSPRAKKRPATWPRCAKRSTSSRSARCCPASTTPGTR